MLSRALQIVALVAMGFAWGWFWPVAIFVIWLFIPAAKNCGWSMLIFKIGSGVAVIVAGAVAAYFAWGAIWAVVVAVGLILYLAQIDQQL
ncbi:hypothetical protein A3A84_00960 [Candidatus Collierbacteria bacterium RIFCSPLOWO2_01_FULL_50_23]|uniref:Major facilitator superfamily (MFS) profile domain-containing protein n=2 Tax=Candidatus Collieribacteriota TaxID=1752725 RepID=A0A1F5EV54_9BACT|nr:MAG: hypothetical protein A2703_01300 [Candidatus Collierbacteria bacterium RIFCSPHIGHO2_01_FULL_50_25]OGD71267.1 MAG: hypothetical protein A3D09_01695 [Candidatus Collierbacteria bacterium RIFCSPHIGHO2_02_FULL_49_10]OGD74731.1 MAG: hypothetical protein A3A84_00960 [Candidatus Collierbacteria bacterium RIFCSPLOWO2_01_FULL_50_23]